MGLKWAQNRLKRELKNGPKIGLGFKQRPSKIKKNYFATRLSCLKTILRNSKIAHLEEGIVVFFLKSEAGICPGK